MGPDLWSGRRATLDVWPRPLEWKAGGCAVGGMAIVPVEPGMGEGVSLQFDARHGPDAG